MVSTQTTVFLTTLKLVLCHVMLLYPVINFGTSNASDVFAPRTKTKIGDRAFEVAGPRTWNSLLQLFGKPKSLLLSKSS